MENGTDTTLNQSAYYCIALSPENYADDKVRTSGRKLTATSANRKLEFKFNKSVKATVEKESTGTVVYISLNMGKRSSMKSPVWS